MNLQFVPSLAESIKGDAEPDALSYALYLGFDAGDPLFDNVKHRQESSEAIKRIVGDRVSVLELLVSYSLLFGESITYYDRSTGSSTLTEKEKFF